MKSALDILLVEDSIADAEMTIRALRKVNLAHNVIHVTDGEQALDLLFGKGAHEGSSVTLPKIIMLDIKMPRVDGIEVLRQLKHDERT